LFHVLKIVPLEPVGLSDETRQIYFCLPKGAFLESTESWTLKHLLNRHPTTPCADGEERYTRGWAENLKFGTCCLCTDREAET